MEMTGIQFLDPLVPARFLRRLNRFAALVDVDGKQERVHVRNSGRLHELFTPGRLVLLEPTHNPERQTRFTVALVRVVSGWVSTDAHLPNALVEEGLCRGAVPGFRGYRLVRREPVIGRNRVDFLFARGNRECFLEVKSVTLVKAGVALFPDAPTFRGRMHLEHLIAERRHGVAAGILFVVQRGDARGFAPNWAADPEFGQALLRAWRTGVRVAALGCRVNRRSVELHAPIPVRLGPRATACKARKEVDTLRRRRLG